MSELRPATRLFVSIISGSAVLLLIISMRFFPVNMTWILACEILGWSAASLALEKFSIRLPSAAVMSISTVTFFPMILFLPPPVPAVLGAVIVIAVEFSGRKPVYKTVFNASNYVLTFGLSGIAWHFLSSSQRFAEATALRDILGVAVTIAVFYAVNAGITNTVVALEQRRSTWYVWSTNDKPVVLPTLSLCTVGALLAVIWHYVPAWTVLTVVPIAITYLAFHQIRRLEDETKEAIEAMADSIDARDSNTYQHSIRVAEYARKIAERMELSYDMVDLIHMVARVHDLGKIGVPNKVLFKKGELQDDEWDAMKKHPEIGADILAKYRQFRRGADIVRHHHERYDGKGYPEGLKGKHIPIGSRVIAVADSYDAMISDRPYRQGIRQDWALQEISRCMSSQFDPIVAGAFLSVLEEEMEELYSGQQAAMEGETVALADGA